MARVALPAPTITLGAGPAGTILPAAEPTSLNTFTGFSFVNNGAILVRLVVGASGVGNVTFNFQKTVEGQLPAAFVTAVANTTVYIFGPFSVQDFNDANGLCQFDKSGTVTGDTVGLYFAPAARA